MHRALPVALAALGLAVSACSNADHLTSPTAPVQARGSFAGAVSPTSLVASLTARSGRTYRVAGGGLAAGDSVYTDRAYAFDTIPAEIRGAAYVRAPNDDKTAYAGSDSLLTFTLGQEADVFVAHDDLIPRPKWLTARFTPTGRALVTTDGSKRFTLFGRRFAAGRVTLGANSSSPTDQSMYSVIVVPAAATAAVQDTVAPTASFTTPTSGRTVGGSVVIGAEASDAGGITGVSFAVDGAPIGVEDTAAPYWVRWASNSIADGTHTLTIVARDRAGNRATTARSIAVRNGVVAATTKHAGFHVTPSASTSGDGTSARPWSLAAAMSQPSAVQPGDTIWMHGGTYKGAFTSRLTGSPTKPVVLRQYPGERATIDGNLVVLGANTVYWGFEVTSTAAHAVDLMAVNVQGPGTKFVNMVVHDAGGNGFGVWSPAVNAEVYGSLVYNNGRQRLDGVFAHGIYAQNSAGTQRFAHNVVFNQFGYGVHMYGSSSASLKGFLIEGNAIFESGRSASDRGAPNILVGGGSAAERVTVRDNALFSSTTDGTNVSLGWASGTSTNRYLTATNNYIVGGKPALRVVRWAEGTVTGNTLYQAGPWEMVNIQGSTSGLSWSGNTHYKSANDGTGWIIGGNAYTFAGFLTASRFGDSNGGTAPTGTRVIVHPNQYEAGRANVIVYNWARAGSVTAGMGGVLNAGDAYEVRNVHNFYGTPVATGTYSGGAITIPMTAVPSPVPVGGFVSSAPPSTTQFQTFVVMRRAN